MTFSFTCLLFHFISFSAFRLRVQYGSFCSLFGWRLTCEFLAAVEASVEQIEQIEQIEREPLAAHQTNIELHRETLLLLLLLLALPIDRWREFAA